MEKRNIYIIFKDRQTNKVIEENLPIEFYTNKLEKNKTPDDKGRYCLEISDNLSEIIIKRTQRDEEYFIKKKMHLQINQNTEYFLEIPPLNWFTKLIHKYSSKLTIAFLGGITVVGGISFISTDKVEINIMPKKEVNNKLDIDPRDYWDISVNEYAEASYFCDDCRMVYVPGKNLSDNQLAPIIGESDFYAIDIPYNYKIKLNNNALIRNIYVYNWEDGEKDAIILEHDALKNEIGGYDTSCGEGCTLNVALSAEGNSLAKINLEQSISEALSENKSNISEIEKNESGYMGIYYQYTPLNGKNQKSYLDPKISKGIIRIVSSDSKSYYYIYVQLKSYNRSAQTEEIIPGESRNKSLIMTEDEFLSKEILNGFLEENSELLVQMQKECNVIEEKNQLFGTDSACDHLTDIEDYLYNELSSNLEEIKIQVKEVNKKINMNNY